MAEQTGAIPACSFINPDALCRDSPEWPGGAVTATHFASVVIHRLRLPGIGIGRLAPVSDESDVWSDAGSDAAADDLLDEAGAALREARARLAEVPAETVVVNHVMGLYELAAIHLSATPPRLPAAALAIDAVACLVDGLGERLGPETPTLRDALGNIRIAFVQIKGQADASHPDGQPED